MVRPTPTTPAAPDNEVETQDESRTTAAESQLTTAAESQLQQELAAAAAQFEEDQGDFENDETLTEQEKAGIRKLIADHKTTAKKVTFEFADEEDLDDEYRGHDGERIRAKRRQSFQQVTDPAKNTRIYFDYDPVSDVAHIELFKIHDDGQEEILYDIRDGSLFKECVDAHSEVMYAHMVSNTYHVTHYRDLYEQQKTESKTAEDSMTARVKGAVDKAVEAAVRDATANMVPVAQVNEAKKRLDRCTTLKNKYAADAAQFGDEIDDLRRRNAALYQKLQDYAVMPQQPPPPPPPGSPELPNYYNPYLPTGSVPLHSSPPPLHQSPVPPPAQPTVLTSGAAGPARSMVSANLTHTGSKLPNIDVFRGDESDKKDYKFWRRSAQNFLSKTNVYTTVQDQMDYVIDHLRGPAGQRVEYRSTKGARNPYTTVEDIFEELNRVYDTLDPTSEASARLHDGTLKQGDREGFDAWIGRFTSTLAPLVLSDHEMVQHAIRLMRFGGQAAQLYRKDDRWDVFMENCRTQQQMRRLTSGGNRDNNTGNTRGGRGGRGGGNAGNGSSRNYGRTRVQMQTLLKQAQCFKCGGTANVNGEKHRATDDDAPAACKNGPIVPAARIPALRSAVTSAAVELDATTIADGSEN
jgi:hypothetical protein